MSISSDLFWKKKKVRVRILNKKEARQIFDKIRSCLVNIMWLIIFVIWQQVQILFKSYW